MRRLMQLSGLASALAVFLWTTASPSTQARALHHDGDAERVALQDAQTGRGQGGGRGGGRGAGRGARTRKAVLAWADTRNGIAQHDSVSQRWL